MMEGAEMRELIKKRGTIRGRLTRFRSNVEKVNCNDITAVRGLQLRLSQIETALDEFNVVQDRIECLDTLESMDAHEAERVSFENDYYDSKAKALQLIENVESNARPILSGEPDALSDVASVAGSLASTGHQSQIIQNDLGHIKLPTLSLPVFSGLYEEWMNFFDTFNSLINQNNSLTNIQRFHYLKSTLKGDAALLIQSIEVSSENYELAWGLLRDRYENTALIIQNHVKALFELNTISRESHVALQLLLNNTLKHLRALKTLKQPVDKWDTLIIYLTASKVDPVTKREWEKLRSELSVPPTIDDMTHFLTKKCQVLESLSVNKHQVNEKAQPRVSNISVQKVTCKFCKEGHPLHLCKRFLTLNISDRINEVSKLNICKNCLRHNHTTKYCKSSAVCQQCKRKHNTLLHLPTTEQNVQAAPAESISEGNGEQVEPTIGLNCSQVRKTRVLLPTALINVLHNNGERIQCRVLLDSASQSNFMTQNLFDRLELKGRKVNFPISGINNSRAHVVNEANLTLESRANSFRCTISCLVLSEITQHLPQVSFNEGELSIPNNLPLADPTFGQSNKIDLLLGAELFWQIICIGQISLGKNLPVVQKTHFGWVISGPMTLPQPALRTHVTTCCFTSTENNNKIIQEQLASFWRLEEITQPINDAPENITCEEQFSNSTFRNEQGRFVVRLPFKPHRPPLGESYNIAYRRLLSLEKRLEMNPELRSMYCHFMEEYERLNHMTEVNYSNDTIKTAYFLPHHAVVKPHNTTTKLRVVFNGSSKTSTGISLNQTLMVGPTVQSDLFSILLRFRIHQIAFTSDCEKMYRQVLVHEDDRINQNILWRSDESQLIKSYQLNTVTYGTASAPYLATRCLLQIAMENDKAYPEASSIIRRDFYVDDLISGSDTREHAVVLIKQINALLSSAGFPMRKWAANDPESLHSVNHTSNIMQFNDTNVMKTLGLTWNADSDTFMYPVKMENDSIVTKRTILSAISKIFDPLGLVGPVIVTAKIILQKLWTLNLDWDESLPMALFTWWSDFCKGLKELDQIVISRCVVCPRAVEIHLHGFADASETSYGACLFLRSVDNIGQVKVSLLCSKGRVAPLKTVTLPRLELCAAHLLAKLTHRVLPHLNINIDQIHYWSDSTIVLAWINKTPNQLKTFVANRISEIITLTNASNWHHVRSQCNPADIISRGLAPNKLTSCSLWWNGPDWLANEPSSWPIYNIDSIHGDVPELKSVVAVTMRGTLIDDLIQQYSNITSLQRVIAYCLRFITNCSMSSMTRSSGPLKVPELRKAMKVLIRSVQEVEFSTEIMRLKQRKPLKPSSKLLNLNPFLDSDNLLRVGGRLKNSDLNYNTKHPLILPSKHHLTILLVRHFHLKYFHAGPQAVISALRQLYWPLSATTIVKGVIRRCVTCKRLAHRPVEPQMGDLPRARVFPSRPFSVCGTDFAGPFTIRDSIGRGRKTRKAYLCVFVCFSTKAVHAEVVSSLSTEAFIACLTRFISRRGLCHTVHSDNGTNFVGANRELKAWYDLQSSNLHNLGVSNFLSQHAITWNFIPARSPHFGGIWEAAVKSFKRHFQSITRNHVFTFEELSTLSTQVEAILNSRPLIPLSTNPDDNNFLCPAHFLIGDTMLSFPEPNLLETKPTRLRRFQLIQQLKQQFWKKWSSDYLAILQKRAKWHQSNNHFFKVGTLVLLRDQTPALLWRMGRIVELHPGSDGITRVVSIKTTTGIVKRAVTQICELLTDQDEDA